MFRVSYGALCDWKRVVSHLMGSDETAFSDLAVRAMAFQSNVIFANKEGEVQQRARLLKVLILILIF